MGEEGGACWCSAFICIIAWPLSCIKISFVGIVQIDKIDKYQNKKTLPQHNYSKKEHSPPRTKPPRPDHSDTEEKQEFPRWAELTQYRLGIEKEHLQNFSGVLGMKSQLL